MAFDILGIAHPVEGMPTDRRAEIERDGKRAWTVRQGFPDLVLVHGDSDSEPEHRIVITVEAQSENDDHKRYMIPVYQSHLAEEHESQAWAVVVSLSELMSSNLRAWRDGPPPRVDALVLDVQSVPQSPWLDHPALRPTAAVLVGAVHGYAGDFEAARVGFGATRWMPEKRRQRHGMTILAAVTQAQREQLLRELPMQERNQWIEAERRSGTFQVGRKEGVEEGLEQGLEQGREQGLEQGRVALLELIFELLARRGIAVDAAGDEQIRSCRDLTLLQRWARRALDATSLDELLER